MGSLAAIFATRSPVSELPSCSRNWEREGGEGKKGGGGRGRKEGEDKLAVAVAQRICAMP